MIMEDLISRTRSGSWMSSIHGGWGRQHWTWPRSKGAWANGLPVHIATDKLFQRKPVITCPTRAASTISSAGMKMSSVTRRRSRPRRRGDSR